MQVEDENLEYVHSLLHPVASRLCDLFGFQKTQVHVDTTNKKAAPSDVPSNASNAVEHVGALIHAAMQRMPRGNAQLHLRLAVEQVRSPPPHFEMGHGDGSCYPTRRWRSA